MSSFQHFAALDSLQQYHPTGNVEESGNNQGNRRKSSRRSTASSSSVSGSSSGSVFGGTMNTSSAHYPLNGGRKRVTDSDLSQDTRLLIKEMMKSSKLSFTQQRYLDNMVSDQGFLPLHPLPIQQDLRKDVQKVAQSAERHFWFNKTKPALRTLNQIKEAGCYEVEEFRTTPMKNSGKEKERFVQYLEAQDLLKDGNGNGISGGVAPTSKSGRRPSTSSTSFDAASSYSSLQSPPPPLSEVEMLADEISDRRKWLSDMSAIASGGGGRNKNNAIYKKQMENEIQLRMSRLSFLQNK